MCVCVCARAIITRRGLPLAKAAAKLGCKVADRWGSEHGWCQGVIVAADGELVRVRYSS